ncbi:MAG: serine/threonine protein kinase [Polyangiaceae bacterium]
MASRLDPYALIGTTFRDRYRVEAFTGVGRFAAVYRAVDVGSDGRPVALRLLKVKDTLTPSRRTIIVERLRGLTQSIHEVASRCPAFAGVPEVGSVITSEGRWMPVIVQTWIEGETLESVLVRENLAGAPPRALARAIDLLSPVADALGYAHARGLVHGSLSTRNLFVRDVAREDWSTVEILDLGIAQALATTHEKDRAFAEPPFGALHFFAPTHGSPEHFAGDLALLGPPSDVFALALIVGELVTGTTPLGEGDDDQLRAAAVNTVVRPTPGTHRRDLGGYVEGVFARALAVRAADRYGSVSAFWEALRAASRMTTLRPSSSSSVRPPPLPAQIVPREIYAIHGAGRAPESGMREVLSVRQSSPPPVRQSSPPPARQSSPPPGFFESAPPSSIPGTNPLFAGEPREMARGPASTRAR